MQTTNEFTWFGAINSEQFLALSKVVIDALVHAESRVTKGDPDAHVRLQGAEEALALLRTLHENQYVFLRQHILSQVQR